MSALRTLGLLAALVLGTLACEGEPPAPDEPEEEPAPEEEAAVPDPEPEEDEEGVIGEWEQDMPGIEGVYRIRETDDGFLMEREFDDGSSGTVELVEVPRDRPGRRFQEPDPPFGEYYLIVDGRLQMWDEEGVIRILDVVDP